MDLALDVGKHAVAKQDMQLQAQKILGKTFVLQLETCSTILKIY